MRTKMESRFEDVSSLIFIDFCLLLVSIWDPKIDKNRTKIKRFLEAIWDAILDDFEIKWDRIGVTSGSPGLGPAEGAEPLEA